MIKKYILMSMREDEINQILHGNQRFIFRNTVTRAIKDIELDYGEYDLYLFLFNKEMVGKKIIQCRCQAFDCFELDYKKNNFDGSSYERTKRERIRFLKNCYFHWCKDFKKTVNYRDGWFTDQQFRKYLKRIGFSEDANYAIEIINPTSCSKIVSLDSVVDLKNNNLVGAPKNMCYIKNPFQNIKTTIA